MRRIVVLSLVAIVVFLGLGFSWKEARWVGQTMGTTYSIHAFLPGYLLEDSDATFASLNRLVEQKLAQVNQSMSTYLEDSEISRLNRAPASNENCIAVSQQLMDVLSIALDIHTDIPVFDVTLGPLLNLWGFGGKSTLTLDWQPPSQDGIADTLRKVGFDQMQLDPSGCVIKSQDMELDVSSIAKGYGVDTIAKAFKALGVQHFLIEIGGEIYVSGYKPGLRPWAQDSAWVLGIEQPQALNESEAPQARLALQDMAIATSGDYRNFFEYNGKAYSHILNPETGWPVALDQANQNLLISVSIIHEETAVADGLATALFALGFQEAQAYAEKHDLKVSLIGEDQSKNRVSWVSESLQPLMQHNTSDSRD